METERERDSGRDPVCGAQALLEALERQPEVGRKTVALIESSKEDFEDKAIGIIQTVADQQHAEDGRGASLSPLGCRSVGAECSTMTANRCRTQQKDAKMARH